MTSKGIIRCDKRGHEIDIEVKGSEVGQALRVLTQLQRAQSYKAAETHRHNRNWIARNEDINTVLQRELKTMRARSRWLARNHPIGVSAVSTFLNYVVGTGFSLQMKVTKTSTRNGLPVVEDAAEFNEAIEDLFEFWSEDVSSNAPASCPDDFVDVQEMMLRRLVEDGEIFVHMRYNKAKDIVPLELEIMDADYLNCSITQFNGNPVMLGVEVDKTTWTPVAYHFYSSSGQDPRSYSKSKSHRIPAENVIHLFVKHFPLQLRGVPFFTGSTERFFQTDEYDNAQVIRSKVNAMVALLISGGDGGGSLLQENGDNEETDSNGFPIDADGNILSTMAPGMIGRIPEGFTAETVNPTSPESSYSPFMAQQHMAMGVGMEYGLSYTSLTRDTSKTTFAGGRQAENMDTQAYRRLMRKFSRKGLSPIPRRWMDLAVLSGAVSIAGYELHPKKWQRHAWMPSGWTRGINPLQEVNASEKSMDNFITTLQDECAFQGRDWNVQLEKAARVKKKKEKLGLTDEDESAQQVDGSVAATKMDRVLIAIEESAFQLSDILDRVNQER